MSEVFNLRDLELSESHNAREGHRFLTRGLGAELGAQHASSSIYELPPGEAAGAYHYELSREEWILVITGELTLRTPEGERTLHVGDVACFPPGPAGAHSVRNDGTVAARYTMFSDTSASKAIVYPDSGKIFVSGPGFHHMTRLGDDLSYWEGEA